MDCSRCRHGEVVGDGVYTRDGGTTFVLAGGGCNTRCTKESVSSITFIGGDAVCSDFEEKEMFDDEDHEVRLSTEDLDASEFEAVIRCPYCGEADSYFFRDLFFSRVRQECDFCGGVFYATNEQ